MIGVQWRYGLSFHCLCIDHSGEFPQLALVRFPAPPPYFSVILTVNFGNQNDEGLSCSIDC
jgi:hypothetical protein